MNRKKFNNMIRWVAGALVLLIAVQLYWATRTYRLREQQFQESVTEVMAEVAREVEDESLCFEMFGTTYIKPGQGIYVMQQPFEEGQFLPTDQAQADTVGIYAEMPNREDLFQINSLKFNNPATVEVLMKFRYHLEDTTKFKQDRNSLTGFEDLNGTNFRERVLQHNTLAERVDTLMLDTLLSQKLAERSINSTFHYGIREAGQNHFEYLKSESDSLKLAKSSLAVSLFSDERFTKPYELVVNFPHRTSWIIQSMWVMLLASVLVILVLVYAFSYFVKTIRDQKKLSEMRNDFINNMTHEFKTPITNIGLALETIDAQHWVNGNQKFRDVLHIIEDESVRLQDNTERILQISRLSQGKVRLEQAPTDLHQVVDRVLKNMEVQFESSQVQVTCQLDASFSELPLDEGHIVNVLYNLIDNAIKYSNGRPKITISTQNVGEQMVLTVADEGVGMKSSDMALIFDQFYRVPTGNRHDVKGFGLGLPYVKQVVEAHGGQVKVFSEPGRGTRFEIYLLLMYESI